MIQKVITFFGGDSQTGTTMLAASVAQALKDKGQRVLLILASSEIDEGFFGTDDAIVDLSSMLRLGDNITSDDVLSAIEQTPNFDLIKGIKDPLKKQFFLPTALRAIKDIVERNCDYNYVIIDGGHDITLPLCNESLLIADKRYFVLTGNDKCVTRFRTSYMLDIASLGVNESNSKLILNKENKKSNICDLPTLKELFGMDGYAVPAYDSPETYELNKQTAYAKVSAYRKAIDLIVLDIQENEKK